ncbi:hypothetical protein C8Q80DRAFT_1270416 [Daedaleopsis nitida]|nr:hypothetical protein C8Q80DRAFT_1270416 [Daedaleopsis nitida]
MDIEELTQVPYSAFPPQHTITFTTNSGEGVNLGAALLGALHDLHHKDGDAFSPEMGVNAKIGLRIQVQGYPEYTRQINARRANRGADPIPLARLCTKIAEEMQKYMVQNDLRLRGHTLNLDNVVLKKLYHVSQGSWQPEFAVVGVPA